MAKITATNALKLSAWLAMHEPGLFRVLLVSLPKLQRSPGGRLGYFGDDSTLTEVTVNVPDTSITPAFASDPGLDITAGFVNPSVSLADVSLDPVNTGALSAIDQAITSPPADTPASASASAPSFWTSLGSGVSSVLGSVGKVAGALVAPATLAAAGGVAAAYFNAQGKTATANAQQAVVNAQLARTYNGGSPAPITYTRNPVTGALTPVYASNTGYQPVTASLLGSLSGSGTVMGIPSKLFIGGAIAIAIVAALSLAKR